MNLLIKNGNVFIKGEFKAHMDVYIEESKIKDISHNIEIEAFKIIDATDCYVIPGLIDMHCIIGEPGYEYKDTIETASYSAAKGGFTSITVNPQTSPVIDNKTVVEFVMAKAKEDGKVHIYPYGSMTKQCKGIEIAEIGEMRFSGIVAVSDGDRSVQDANLLSKIMKYTSMLDIPIITHCEDTLLSFESGVNDGKIATYLGLKGAIKTAEEIILGRNLLLADYYQVPIHITHVSTKESVDLIRLAKQKGIPVTAETSPHYFILDEESVLNYNTLTKVTPPLRKQEDIQGLLLGLKDGTIDVISSDHQPNTIDSKMVEFDTATFGISSLETAFPLAYTHLVSKNIISLENLIKKMSKKPSEILEINKGEIKIGGEADITIFKKEPNTIIANEFKSKAKFSPFDGEKVDITINNTIVSGKEVNFS